MRKNLIKLLSVVALVAVLASCSSQESKVKQVSEKYLKALSSMNFEEAKKYSTPESAKLIDFLAQVSGMQKPEELAKTKEEAANFSYEFTKVEIKENDATVTYIVKDKAKKEDAEAKKEEQTLSLKKVDGNWLVHQPKENPAALDGGAATEEPATTTVAPDSNAAKTEAPAAAPAPAKTETPAPAHKK